MTDLDMYLDDLCVRFIMNVPREDLSSSERICFQIEEAQWFYEDFIRPLDPSLPSMSLRQFSDKIFSHCPILSTYENASMAAYEQFLHYKSRIPVRGAIMLNAAMDSVILVKGWKKGANWSFPRGKINMEEDDLDCAIREVYEETGYNLEDAGLVPQDRNVKFIDINMQHQQYRLYVFKDIPEDTYFEPRTRKEISKIEWWKLSDLPAFRKKGPHDRNAAAFNANKFFMVAPFLAPLRKWVIEQKKRESRRVTSNQYASAGLSHDDPLTEEDAGAESGTQLHYPDHSGNENMADATTRLRDLLSFQNPPEEDQESQDDMEYQPNNGTKGSALLALLQSKPTAEQPRAQNGPLPHTPLENYIEEGHMPRTPHHYAPRPPPFSSMVPPPNFPIQQQQQQQFAYQQPTMPIQHQPILQPPHQYYPQHMQSGARPRENQHHYQSQHLIHPQPLPPTVQRALFTGGPVHSPVVPQAQPLQPMASHYPPNASIAVPNPQFPGLHAPMVPAVRKESPPKLTKHSLALLDAFKRRDQDVADSNASKDLPLRGFAPEQPQVSRHQPQELPADASQLPQGQSHPQYVSPNNTSSGRAPVPSMFPSRQPISDTQKSTLLDLFKSPAGTAASPSKPLSATALPPSATPSAVELSAVEPLSSNAATTSALLNDKRTPDPSSRDEPLPELNPEANLPYRAMTILSRPPEMVQREPPVHNSSSQSSHSKGRRPLPRPPVQEPAQQSPEKKFQPQILRRPQPSQSSAPEPPRSMQQPPMPSMQEMTADHRKHQPAEPRNQQPADHRKHQAPGPHNQQPADHRQNLLSLFGKSPPNAQPPNHQNSGSWQTSGETSSSLKSRVGSLASSEAAPRRQSQAPISPANKGFLLDYLAAAVAKGT